MRKLIDYKDYSGVSLALSNNPLLANEGIPYDSKNMAKAHPLHRLCDVVFTGKYTDDEAIEMAKLFLRYGADINGGELIEKKDSPLIAASSLHADGLAFFYMEKGADIYHAGTHGGTALHWAAWCGRDKVVEKLLWKGAEINKRCIDFKSTPLFWAVKGLKEGDKNDRLQHLECIRLLVQAGADNSIPNAAGTTVFELLDNGDLEVKNELSR